MIKSFLLVLLLIFSHNYKTLGTRKQNIQEHNCNLFLFNIFIVNALEFNLIKVE